MMVEQPFINILEKIASKSPTPGGGSVAAMVGAIACSLAEMVCNLTIGKKKYADVEDDMKEYASRMKEARKRFEELVDEDARAFDEVMNAYKSNDKGKIENAMKKAAETPLNTAMLCREIAGTLVEIARKGNKNAITDAGVAAYMMYTCFNSAVFNVRINLKYIEDENFKEITVQKLNEAEKEIKESFDLIIEEVERELK